MMKRSWLIGAFSMTAPTQSNQRCVWLWFGAFVPWLLLTLLVSVALHLRIGLGHWPRACWDHYQSEAFAYHFTALALAVSFAVPFSVPIYIGLLVGVRGRLFLPLIHGLGWFAIVLFCVYDPTNFVAWFLD